MGTPLPDQHERVLALDLSQSFIIQAPAGSGKTEILIQRYLALLARAHVPEEVLAITFTRKAAFEMRHRVIDALKSSSPDVLAQAVLRRDQEKEWGLQHGFYRLRILTIDALCNTLVRQIPLKTFLSERAEFIEDNDDEIYIKTVHQLFDSLSEEVEWKTSLQKLLLHLDNNFKLAERLLVDLLKKRDQWLTQIGVGKVDLYELRIMLEKSLANHVEEYIKKIISEISKEDKNLLAELACYASNNVFFENEIKYCSEIKNIHNIKDISYWRGLSKLLLTQSGVFRKTVTVKEGFPVSKENKNKERMLNLLESFSKNKRLEKQFETFFYLPMPVYEDSQWEILSHLLSLLPVLVAHLQVLFQKTGKTDYVEIMLKALAVLGEEGEPSDLALDLDYKIQHILVDEFQDTSLSQFHLLEKLTLGWQNQDGRTLFLVGDPMQSIYRFRKAEVGLFIRAVQKGLGSIRLKLLILSSNFRSQRSLLDWVNAIFSKIFPFQDDIVSSAIKFSSSVAIHQNEAAVISFQYSEEGEIAEACRIKEIIDALLQKDPSHKIAILVRSRSHLNQIISLLKTTRIPFSSNQVSSIFESSVVQDLISLTRALLYLSDRSAWLAVLRAQWCGLNLKDLSILAKDHDVIWESLLKIDILALSDEGRGRVKTIMPVLQKALTERQRHALSFFIEMVWTDLKGDLFLKSEEDWLRKNKFLNFLFEIEKGGDICDRAGFEKKLKMKFMHEKNENESSVELMTIHKAKGLEFDTVILPGLQNVTKHDPHTLLLWMECPRESAGEDLYIAPLKSVGAKEHDSIYRYLRHMENEKAKNELLRLFYVALTRAKKNLFLTWSDKTEKEKPFIPRTGSFLSLIYPHIKNENLTKIIFSSDFKFETIKKLRRIKKEKEVCHEFY